MSITRKKHWMFAAMAAGTIALAGCAPAPAPSDAAAPAAKSVDALAGLKIVQAGPTSAKAGVAFNAQPDGSSAIWAKADRELDGYDAALWLDGKRLDNRGIKGSTVSGTIPASMLATAGTFPLEIRIGKDGTELSSEKIDFVVE